MVPRRGLEPPHLAVQVPETCASTNSAIWALTTGSLQRSLGRVNGQKCRFCISSASVIFGICFEWRSARMHCVLFRGFGRGKQTNATAQRAQMGRIAWQSL